MDCFVTLVLFRRFQSQADLGKAVSLPLLALDSSLMSDATLFSASQYQTICASLPDPVFILTLSGRYAAVLGGKDKRYYHDGTSLVGKCLGDVLAPAKAQWFVEQIGHALRSGQMLVVEYQLSVHDVLGIPHEGPAEPIWFEGRISALAERFDGEPAVVWVASNITASKQMQQQLRAQALSDELTGLSNRRGFMLELAQAYEAYLQRGRSACLMSFDVDRFKAINDGLGHPAGDQALRDLARVMQSVVAPEDVLCRLGGDEFAILCRERSIAYLTDLMRRLLEAGGKALKQYTTQGPAPALSLGAAHFNAADTSLEDIMRRADQALYAAKAQQGSRRMFMDSQRAADRDQL